MPDPVVIPREHHPISRRDIDPDALRVLYRLQENHHTAYLVGGSVRDLILGRRPKDFDIGTDAHPYQIKRLFRNCWIIGRRFRLAHIKFGTKTIEVATFRRNVSDLADAADGADAGAPGGVAESVAPPENSVVVADHHGLVHRDNTFGTPEEDAFRRDFTVNALFYDVSTRSVIDYVGGLEDIERRVIRSIGDPRVRFVEDPVRMFRAAVLGARLGLDLDAQVVEAIAELRPLIAKASPARLLEEYFKILRSGSAEASFRALARVRLLELMSPELKSPPESLWDSLARLDRYRQRSSSLPPELTNAVLIGSLLHPIGALKSLGPDRGSLMVREAAHADAPLDSAHDRPLERDDRVSLGAMPIPRRDVDRLRQVLPMLPRLADPQLPPRVAKSLPHRPGFADAVTWMDVFGDDPAVVEPWKALREAHPQRPAVARKRRRRGRGPGGAAQHAHHGHQQHPPHHAPPHPAPHSHGQSADGAAPKRRRRRRRRRGGPQKPSP